MPSIAISLTLCPERSAGNIGLTSGAISKSWSYKRSAAFDAIGATDFGVLRPAQSIVRA